MIRKVYNSGVGDGGFGASLTLAGVPVFGSNPLLVVCASIRSGAISAVSWNGNAFTQAVEAYSTYTYGLKADIWYLVPPAPGTYDVVLTLGGSSYKACAILLNDVNQSSPVDGTGSAVRTGGTELSPSLTTSANNSIVIQTHAAIVSNSGSAQLNGVNLNSGQTLIQEEYSGPAGDNMACAYKVVSTAGTNSFAAQFHLNGNTAISQEDIAAVVCGFKQALSPQPNASFLEQLIPI